MSTPMAIAVAGIAVACVFVLFSTSPSGEQPVTKPVTSGVTKWLDAPSSEDRLEDTVLTRPFTPERSAHGYALYPPQKGLHVLKQLGNGTFMLWRDADARGPTRVQVTATSMMELRKQLEPHLQMKFPASARGLQQPWNMFAGAGSRHGQRLDTLEAVQAERLVLVMAGGQWVWPGVAVGHKQPVPGLTVEGRQVYLETLSLVPLVFSISGFLAHEECDFIVENGKDHVAASPVALMDKDKGKPATEWRTSSQAWLHTRQLPPGIKERTASLLRVGIRHQEQNVQFLKYEHGQKYDAHHDYFDMQFYSQQPHVVKQYDNGYKNRLSTVFWYLNDVAEGGETQFPRAGGKHQPSNFAKCQGLRVKPVKGKVILFYSLLPSGDYDPFSLHGGCPVGGDKANPLNIKWAANQWTWNKPF